MNPVSTNHPGQRVRNWTAVRSSFRKLASTAALVLLAIPAAAQAEPGLTVDPESPAGVEYAVPLDHARNPGGGSGGSAGNSGGGGSGQLFGAGITPSSGSSAGPRGRSGDGQDGKSTGDKKANGGDGGGGGNFSPAAPTTRPTAAVEASTSYSTSGWLAGLIAAILLVGGGLGLFLRLRSPAS